MIDADDFSPTEFVVEDESLAKLVSIAEAKYGQLPRRNHRDTIWERGIEILASGECGAWQVKEVTPGVWKIVEVRR